MRPAALVTDPAGESDGEPLGEKSLELGGGARETVDEGAFGGKSRLAPESEEVGVGLAHMEKERSSAALRERELRGEGALLLRARTQETEVVEPTLADADHPRVVEDALETAERLVRPHRGVVRMTARGHPHPGGMTAVEIRGPEALLEGGAGDEEDRNVRGPGAGDDLLPVAFVALVEEIGAGVEKEGRTLRHGFVQPSSATGGR